MAFGPNNEKDPLLEQHAPGLWSAVRLGGMGVALAPVLGEELADGLMGE
jgi:glycine/D-amino acid oxidase-like deaminating enzyme